MPFWKRKEPVSHAQAEELETYLRRASNSLEMATEAKAEADLRGRDQPQILIKWRYLIGRAINNLEALPTPTTFPFTLEHKQNQLDFMRLQYEKVNDIIENGGQNLPHLEYEEQVVNQRIANQARTVEAASRAIRWKLGR